MKKVLIVVLVLMYTSAMNVLLAQDNNTDDHTITFTIPNVALLDIEGGTTIDLGPEMPTPLEAGEAPDWTVAATEDNSLWLNYTSIKPSGVTSRKVSVKITGTLPDNTTLKVESAAPTGIGGLGTAAAQLTLSTSDQDIITGITSCYTLNGDDHGANLTYKASLTGTANFGDLDAQSLGSSVTVTYTLVDVN